MKCKNVKILFTFIIVIGISCSKDSTPESVDGDWYLVEYLPSSWQNNSQTIEYGQIKWTFNSKKKQITVTKINNEDLPLLENGIYSYEFGDNGCNYEENLFIIIDGKGYGILNKTNISNKELKISNACVDGHVLTFER